MTGNEHHRRAEVMLDRIATEASREAKQILTLNAIAHTLLAIDERLGLLVEAIERK